MKKIIIAVVIALLIFPAWASGANWSVEVLYPQGLAPPTQGKTSAGKGGGGGQPPTLAPDTSPNPDCGPGKKYQAGNTYEEPQGTPSEGNIDIKYHDCTVSVRPLGRAAIQKTLSPGQSPLFECGNYCPDKIWGYCKQEQRTNMTQGNWRKTFSNECKATYQYFYKNWVRSIYLKDQQFSAVTPLGVCPTAGAVFCGHKKLKLCRTGLWHNGEASDVPGCMYKFCPY